MAGETKGGYEEAPKIESPEGQKDAKQEILEASQEAAEAAKTFLAETQAEFGRLFGQLEVSGLSEEELAEFSQQYENIISEVEKRLAEVQKEKSLASEGLDLGDIFGAENVVDTSGDLDTQESALANLQAQAETRRNTVRTEGGRRGEEKRRKEEERKQNEEFVPGIEASGLKDSLVFRALEAADPDRVNQLVQEKINYPSEEFAPQIQKAVEAARAELQNKLKELEKEQKKEEETLEKQKGQLREKFEPPANLKTLKEILSGSDQARKEMVFSKLRNIPEGKSPEEFAMAMVEAKIDQEFANDSAAQAELAKLEDEKKELEQKYKDRKAELEQKTSEQEVETIKKMLGEKMVPELLRSDISKDVLSQKLADEIYKEEKGQRGSSLDMRAALNLPEKVTGALLKKYTLAEVGTLVGQGTYKPDKVPAIYWSQAFENRLGELQKEEKALRDSSLIGMKEGGTEYNQLLIGLKEADLAYRKAEVAGDRKQMEEAAKKYNDVIGDELKKMLQIQQLDSTQRGMNSSPALKIGADGRTKVTFNENDGKLFLGGEYFPNSEGKNRYFFKVSEHINEFGMKQRLEEVEKEQGVDARYKKEVDLLLKYYKGVWSRELIDRRTTSPQEEKVSNQRKEYYRKQQEIEKTFEKQVNERETFIAKSKPDIENDLQRLQNLDNASLRKEIQNIENKISNFSGKTFRDGDYLKYVLSQQENTSRDVRVEEMIQATNNAYEATFSDLNREQYELGEKWREALKPFKRKMEEAVFAAERARKENEREEGIKAQQEEAERRRQVEQARAETWKKTQEKMQEENEVREEIFNLQREFESLVQQRSIEQQVFSRNESNLAEERDRIQGILNKNRTQATKFGVFTRTVEAVDNQGRNQKVDKGQMNEILVEQEKKLKDVEDKEAAMKQKRAGAEATYKNSIETFRERAQKALKKRPEFQQTISQLLSEFDRFKT